MSRYTESCRIVRDIYGVDQDDHSYNIHHIVFKRDYFRNRKAYDALSPSGRFDLNGPSNLYPLKIKVHNELHRRVDKQEGYHYPIKRRKKKK